MNKITKKEFLRLRKLVQRDARPLDFTRWNYLFENGNCDDFLSVLASYQNEDGGFGHNIECNNWNPNSSPYTVSVALGYLETVEDCESEIKNHIIHGIVKYLASGSYRLEEGWVGMQGVPSNNEYAHLPWFHFDEQKGKEVDVGLTKRLSEFVLKYADDDTEIYHIAQGFMEKNKKSDKMLLNLIPDIDEELLEKMKSYNPKDWPFWLPSPVDFVGSPESEYYQEYRHAVELNLDWIVKNLQETTEITFDSEEVLTEFEKNNPHPEGKRWCVAEQTIGNYYWGTIRIISNLEVLRTFDRWAFQLPV